ncbi:MAG: ATP-binding protein [Lachnospiraceae bacterium]|nr:ATP-binding protein [Lachnospiraceae bacterium]
MMKQRKTKLTYLLLIPLVLIVFLQGLLPFSVLLVSKVKETMVVNAVDIDNNLVENRRVVLQNAMVDQWSSVRHESTYLDNVLAALLEEEQVTMTHFLENEALQRVYARRVFDEMLGYLRDDDSCGVFLIIGNAADPSLPHNYEGFFLRDSDPVTKTETNSDLLFEKGDNALAREYGIALDRAWASSFAFAGSGAREADDFFYTPYLAAQANTDADMMDLGYWAMPFVLEDNTMDNHRMITYSIPLCLNGQVYGVLGTEIATAYLSTGFLPVNDLDRNQNAGYAISIKEGDGVYRAISGKGLLFDTIRREQDEFILEETPHRELARVRDAMVGEQQIYAVMSDFNLYGGKVPYENTNWTLCGFVTEDSIFGLGNHLYRSILTTIVLCAALGMVIMFVVVRYVSRPVYRLMDSVRGGIKGLRAFQPSNIQEIDELHHVVKNLTENEILTEKQLHEDKERYRIALESSQDMFFTFRQENNTMEIVNSHRFDGVWDVNEFCDKIVKPVVSPRDMAFLENMLAGQESEVHGQIRLLLPDRESYWIEVTGKTSTDEATGHIMVVGYTRDINSIKLLEMERENRLKMDPVTEFYRLKPGEKALAISRRQQAGGVLVLLDICEFSRTVQNYGLTFGDVVLNEFAEVTADLCRQVCTEEMVLIRAGSDEFLLWLPGTAADDSHRMISKLQEAFGAIVRRSALELRFCAGMTEATTEPTHELIARVQAALREARRRDITVVMWEETHFRTEAIEPFHEVMSQDYINRMGLASLILNLLDRRASVTAALDLTARRLQKRFGLEDLLVTSFRGEYLAGMVEYCWQFTETPEGVDPVYYYTDEEYRSMNEAAALHDLRSMEEQTDTAAVFQKNIRPARGIVFPMADNGSYSGSIFFVGVDPEVLKVKDSYDLLWEIGTIIQNRVNLEHHDQSAQAKSDFLARMSHEIRTPMNGIIGMTEIALQEGQSEEVRLDCLKKVRSSSDYLLGLLNDILDMSKIESGKMSLTKADFDLTKLLDGLHPVLDGEFADKGQTFKTDIQLTHSWFHGDALRISQVLINLIGNAVKYSKSGAETTLIVKETPFEAMAEAAGKASGHNDAADRQISRLYFAVKDQGTGISEKDRQRVFGVFEQLDNASAKRQGSGLGLAICNRLIHMMDSEILLDSELGKGSTFYFTLDLPVAEVREQKEEVQADIDLNGVPVLVAEDNELNMEIICAFLEQMGCVVTSAFNGQEALDIFKASAPGAFKMIFMDVMMPVMGGLEAAHMIRTCGHPDSDSIPMIAVSANAFDEDIKSSLASGMNAHISKPIEQSKLKAAVQRFAR